MTRASRPPRLAFLTLPGLGHFAPDLLRSLPQPGVLEVRHIALRNPRQDLADALAWTDDPARDAIWFEFCWPPIPALIAETEFGGRRVVMRVHRIEAYGTDHAARAPWHKVEDALVVGEDMAQRLRAAAPGIAARTRFTVLRNGVDLDRFAPMPAAPDPFRIGWCGWLSLHKNPVLALQVLHRLRIVDPRYSLHMATRGGEPVAVDSLLHLVRRLGLEQAVHIVEDIPQERMAEWHARNAVLLSTSLYESFGYAIAEAAAVGCDLAVLDHPGAEESWPEAVRFGTVEEAVALIRAARPHRWRGLIEARFSLRGQAEAARALLLAPRAGLGTEAAADGGRVVPIRHGAWQGRFLLRDAGDHVQGVVDGTGGFYEAAMLEDLRGRLKPGGVFLDVGANVGNHALFAAGPCGAQVLAVEPSPPLAAHCRANAALNGLTARVEVMQCGLGEAPGSARLVPGPAGNAGMTRLVPQGEETAGDETAGDGAAGDAVPVLRVDDLLAARGGLAPQVMKIDVEGMEAAVLRGATETLCRHRPALYVEAATASDFLELRELLASLGYAPEARFNATPTWLFLPAMAEGPVQAA